MSVISIDGAKYLERLVILPQEVNVSTGLQVLQSQRLVLPGIASFMLKGLTRDTIVQGVNSVSVTNPCSGYTSAPTVTFSASNVANGVTALGYAVIDAAGNVIGVVVTNPGNYTVAPTITFTGGAGANAAATANIGGISIRRPFKFRLGNSDGALWYFQGGVGGTTDRVLDSNCFGTAQFPYPIYPFIPYGANATINYEFEDVANQGPYTAYLAFHGSYLIPLPS